jgi:hypothetical protein
MRASRFYNPQFDLFLPTIVDLKFRYQKDTMERPFFSLSKSKRMKPIEYINENDGIFVTAAAPGLWHGDDLGCRHPYLGSFRALRHEESRNQ